MRKAICLTTALSSSAALTVLLGSGTASAAMAMPDTCPTQITVSIASHSAYFLPGTTAFKDGRGGKITVSVTQAKTLSATLSASAEVSVSDVVASAKATVSKSVTGSVAVTVGHSYEHDISAGKYGNAQYGSWGYKVNWERIKENGNCTSTVLSGGTATLPVSSVGWRYWETSS
ncbi:hypothetical protein [Streptomyces sp. NPDC087212]|uniref:hypothetical protein n=1 Tax=Streptomyces sp. NPDC087212 TaxID=3365766 RepID=UPI0038143D58